jgi:hypothetical protein
MPSSVSPWVWVALIAIAFVAQFAFVHEHVDGGGMVATVVGLAVAGLAAAAHGSTQRELTTLRRSIRPPPDPAGGPPTPRLPGGSIQP